MVLIRDVSDDTFGYDEVQIVQAYDCLLGAVRQTVAIMSLANRYCVVSRCVVTGVTYKSLFLAREFILTIIIYIYIYININIYSGRNCT